MYTLNMIVLLHVAVAVAGLVAAAVAYFIPSLLKLRISYALTGLTLLSGTYLVVSNNARILHTCITGLIYTAITFYLMHSAQNKLISLSAERLSNKD
jgi:hypothetical protein